MMANQEETKSRGDTLDASTLSLAVTVIYLQLEYEVPSLLNVSTYFILYGTS